MNCSSWRIGLSALMVVVLFTGCVAAQERENEYDIGGPLAGLKLPLFSTQHGEPPGFPGCLVDEDGNFVHPPQGNPPLFELYPGSVEQWRAYLHRYVPARPMYDRQSQIHNWIAPDIPGAEPHHAEEYAAPLYWIGSHAQVVDTGKRLAPVPVVRMRAETPVISLDMEELGHGLYVVRLIGTVPTEEISVFRKPMFVRMRVNDGLDGESSEYRLRIAYVDEFYSVAEIYFHAPETRRYRAEIWLDEKSGTDLLLHNVSLDDALAGTERRAIKRRQIWPDDSERQLRPDFAARAKLEYTDEERLARDADIWKAFPGANSHPINDDFCKHVLPTTLGADGKTPDEIAQEHGKWEAQSPLAGAFVYIGGHHRPLFKDDPESFRVFLKNEKLGLEYTTDDWQAQRPLPEPYPYPDDGCGITTPDPDDEAKGMLFSPVAEAVAERYQAYFSYVINGTKTDHPKYARDRAVALIRLAYDWPTIDNANSLLPLVHTPPGRYDLRFRRRNTESRQPRTHVHIELVRAYDEIFPAIQGNEELARSISRFVPWVESSEDLIELLDVYLLQTQAKRLMRYHYYRDGHPALIVPTATMLEDQSVTDPWMEWLFSRTWMYPLRPSGLQDYLISNNDRAGISYIGSTSYGKGAASFRTAELLEEYILQGGNPKYDLRDPARYPKPVASVWFDIRERTAAIHWPRVGDVTGPDKSARFEAPAGALGWRWTKDPAFAFILKHYQGRDGFADDEWREIEEAAELVKRAPWLDNTSRILPNWGAFLEAGVEHDDFRFRRSVMLRIGQGLGHAHNDDLDLQIHAHGIPMTIDAGQRPGYSRPRDGLRIVHNTVEDGHSGGTWLRALTDADGARYMSAQRALPGVYRRQVALIDVSEGAGAVPLSADQVITYTEGLPDDVVTPNSYVFDVFRAGGLAGDATHTYCFHGPVNDPPASGAPVPQVNLPEDDLPEEALNEMAAEFLAQFSGEKRAGAAPDVLIVSQQIQKERFIEPKIQAGTERDYLRQAYDPGAPDKFLRWHVAHGGDALFMQGDLHCHQWEYYIPMFFLQRRGAGLESAFAAVIEPYAGEPFIESVTPLAVADNDNDALRAVALQVRMTNGHTDLCFADGRGDVLRQVGDARVSAEFAYLSRDGEGVRYAAISGGTTLEAPGISIRMAEPARIAKITEVDYRKNAFKVDSRWPKIPAFRVMEIGALPGAGEPGYASAYNVKSFEPVEGGTVIEVEGGADLYRARIIDIDEENGLVYTALIMPIGAFGFGGRFVASNDDMTKFWRAEMPQGGLSDASYRVALSGAPVSAEDFQPSGALRLWEYGVGDFVRLVGFAGVRRIEPGVYELQGDSDVEITLAGETFEITAGQLADNGGRITLRTAEAK